MQNLSVGISMHLQRFLQHISRPMAAVNIAHIVSPLLGLNDPAITHCLVETNAVETIFMALLEQDRYPLYYNEGVLFVETVLRANVDLLPGRYAVNNFAVSKNSIVWSQR